MRSNNEVTGNGVDNMLDGKAGADTMTGGDRQATSMSSTISATWSIETGGDGIERRDAVRRHPRRRRSSDQPCGHDAVAGTGNAQANVITGNSGANALSGIDADSLAGGAGTTRSTGGIGNDTLDGGTGADTLTGGAGNDTYVVDNAKDVDNDSSGLDDGAVDTVGGPASSTAWRRASRT